MVNLATRMRNAPWPTFRSWLSYGAVPLVGLATAPMLARALGPDGRGQLAGALQPLTVADAIAAIGVPAAVTYFFARKVPEQQIRKPALTLLAFSTAIVFVGLIAYSEIVSSALGIERWLLVLLWSSVIPGAFLAYRRALFQGAQQYGVLDADRSTGAAFRLATISVLFILGVTGAVEYMFAYILVGLTVSSIVLSRRVPSQTSTGDLAALGGSRAVTKFALLSSASTIAVALNSRLDQAVLPAVLPAAELGYYSVAVTVAEVPTIIAIVLARNLLAERSAGAPKTTVRRTIYLGIAGVAIGALSLASLCPLVIPLAFGPAFEPAVIVAQILLIATVMSAGATTLSVYITASGSAGLGSVGPAVGAVTSILALWLGWSSMTPALAAWITVLSQTAALVAATIVLVALRFRSGGHT